MIWRPDHPRMIRREDIIVMAENLASNLRPFSPDLIVYLEKGGNLTGNLVARALGIPAKGLDISYPLSRPLEKVPKFLSPLLWPAKEATYRLGRPTVGTSFKTAFLNGEQLPRRIGLVDDTASTGRSLARAISALGKLGLERHQMRVCVLRCGVGARDIVDYYLLKEPVLFFRNSR